jgi:hypothetical protein
MGRQHTKAILIGTCANLNGYIDDGKPLVRMVDRRDRRQEGAKEASNILGRASKAAASLWRCMPPKMRKLGGQGAFNSFVGTCQELAAEGAYYWNWTKIDGLQMGGPQPISLNPDALQIGLENGLLDLTQALKATQDHILPFLNRGQAQWRLGAMPIRDGHYDLGLQIAHRRWQCSRYEGNPHDRAWNAQYAAGTFSGPKPEFFDHFGSEKFPSELDDFQRPELRDKPNQRGAIRTRFWMRMKPMNDQGVTGFCTNWVDLDTAQQLQVSVAHIHEYTHKYPDATEWITFFGVEVAEKRARHWVRLPFACALSINSFKSEPQIPKPRKNAQSRQKRTYTDHAPARAAIRKAPRRRCIPAGANPCQTLARAGP